MKKTTAFLLSLLTVAAILVSSASAETDFSASDELKDEISQIIEDGEISVSDELKDEISQIIENGEISVSDEMKDDISKILEDGIENIDKDKINEFLDKYGDDIGSVIDKYGDEIISEYGADFVSGVLNELDYETVKDYLAKFGIDLSLIFGIIIGAAIFVLLLFIAVIVLTILLISSRKKLRRLTTSSNTRRCVNCGKSNFVESTFCTECGYKMK